MLALLGHSIYDDREKGIDQAEPRLEIGIFLGADRASDDLRIWGSTGVVKAIAIKRPPREEQWCADVIRGLTGVPWDPRGSKVPGGEAAASSGEAPLEDVGLPVDDKHDANLLGDDCHERGFGNCVNTEVRNCPLPKADVIKHGYADGCKGCDSIRRRLRPAGHSPECQTRFAELFRAGGDVERRRVERAETRLAEAVLRAAHEDIRKIQEQAGRAVERMAGAAGGDDLEVPVPGPASAEASVEMEDTIVCIARTRRDPQAPLHRQQ